MYCHTISSGSYISWHKGAARPSLPLSSHFTPPPPPPYLISACYTVHYQPVAAFPCFSNSLFVPVFTKRLWFFGGNVANSICKETSSHFTWDNAELFLIHFSKTTCLIALIFLPCFRRQKYDSGAQRHDCLNCKHQPSICGFFSVLQAQILDIASITGAGKCRLKNVQHSLNSFAFRSTPPFHHHFAIHPVLFILCSSIWKAT